MTAGRDSALGAPTDAAEPTAAVPASRWARPACRTLVAAYWLAGVLAALACYLWLARTRAVDSDGAAQALQAWDMLHGNVLLRGWWLSDVSFYTTELPQYAAVELVRGLSAGVVQVAAAITFTLVLLLAALLATGGATGRAALARVLVTVGILVAPQPTAGVKVFVSSPDHVGTTVPVLLAWLILDRARPRWFLPVIVSVVLGLAAVADPLVLVIAVVPLALVCAVRVYQAAVAEGKPLRSQWYHLGLGAGAIAAGVAAQLGLRAIRAAGGFVVQSPVAQFGGVHQLGHGLTVAGQGLLLLAGADFLGSGLSGADLAFSWLHLAGLAVAVLGVCFAMRRFLRERSLVDQLLVTGIVINLLSYVLSTQSGSVLSTREIVAVMPFAAVLAGRMLAERVMAIRRAPIVMLALLACYLGGLGYALAQPPASPQNQQLASWLAAHQLRTGLSGYWQSNIVTLSSRGIVQVRPLTLAGTRPVRYEWESSAAWYDPGKASANFIVLAPGTPEYPGWESERPVLATFGRPAHAYRVGTYLILVWRTNLLRALQR